LTPAAAMIDRDSEKALLRLIERYEISRKPGVYPTLRYMAGYLCHPSNLDLINPDVVDGKLIEFINRGVLVQENIETPDGRPLRITRLNPDDDLVREALTQLS